MPGRLRPKLTYANVMVTILAFVVLGGGAVAAVGKLAKNSVGARQIRNNAVTRAKIAYGAVDGLKVADGSLNAADLSPATLGGYAKSSELNGYLKEVPNGSVGPDKLSTLPAAALEGAIYNVGPGGVDCQGTDSKLPTDTVDDIDFSTVGFDTAGLAHQESPANGDCFNGFAVSRPGTYVVTAWIGWEANESGDREVTLKVLRPVGGRISSLAVSEQAANDSGPANVTAQAVSAVTRLEPKASIFIQGRQTSGGDLGFFDGGIQVAWVGP